MDNTKTIVFEISEEDWFPLWRHKNTLTGEYVQLPIVTNNTTINIKNTLQEPSKEEETKWPRRHN
jgi:hypothetical protein